MVVKLYVCLLSSVILAGCAKHHRITPMTADVPVSARSLDEQLDLFDRANERIAADVTRLNQHHVYSMNIPFRGYNSIKRLFKRPSSTDRAAAEGLLNDIVDQAVLQIQCADALKNEGRRQMAEATLRRVQGTRELLGLVEF